jgi:ribosomal-protein-alanine N-acetyltransferase
VVVRPWQHAGVADLVSLQTERLLLRPWRPEDRAPFAALNADPVVMRWFPSVLTREESDALVDRIEGAFAEHGWGLWAAERRDTGAFTGFIGLSIPGFEAPFLPGVEVGWRLAQEHWGRGFAPEGAAEALRFAFEVLGLAEVLSFTTVGNAKSRRVMEKLGLVHHPDEDFDHPRVPADSPIRPHVLYRITREAWRAG